MNCWKNAIATVQIAIIPNSCGDNSRANIAVTTSCIIMPEYFAAALYNTPCVNYFFKEFITNSIGLIYPVRGYV